MKKSISLILSLIMLMLIFGGCAKKKAVSSGRALVTTDEQFLIVIDGGAIVMRNQSDNDSLFSEIKSGDLIEVRHDSEILATYPGQMTVYSCKVLENGTMDDVPTETVNNLRAMNWEFK